MKQSELNSTLSDQNIDVHESGHEICEKKILLLMICQIKEKGKENEVEKN